MSVADLFLALCSFLSHPNFCNPKTKPQAVGDPHRDAAEVNEDVGVVLTLDGTEYEDDTDIELSAGSEIAGTVTAAGDEPIRGILIRMECDEDATLSTSDGNLQPASVCAAPATGLTHNNNNTKSSLGFTISSDVANECTLDVTIVLVNTEAVSNFGYGGYFLSLLEPAAPTPAPTGPAPTPAPTSPAPTPAPYVTDCALFVSCCWLPVGLKCAWMDGCFFFHPCISCICMYVCVYCDPQ